MRGATMFSGIGAPETAAPWIDWRWCAEIEPFPCHVLHHRHGYGGPIFLPKPNDAMGEKERARVMTARKLCRRIPRGGKPNLGDVSHAKFIDTAKQQGPIDVLVFGSPCQPFSVAGKRLGLTDHRGNLALVALGVVDALRPTWFTFENVPGLISSGQGRDFGAFLGTVEDIGYAGGWSVLDAQWHGVAQRRRRLFFVGHARDWRGPAAVLSEFQSLLGDTPACVQARQRTARSTVPGVGKRSFWQAVTAAFGGGAAASAECAGEAGSVNGYDVAPALLSSGRGVERPSESRGQDPVVAVADTLRSSNNSLTGRPGAQVIGVDLAHALRAEGFDASEDGTGRGTPIVPVTAGTLKSNSGGGGFGSDPSETFVPVATPPPDQLHVAIGLRGFL